MKKTTTGALIALGAALIIGSIANCKASEKEPLPTGRLTMEGADLRGHDVILSKTNEKAGFLSSTNNSIELPVGVYHVVIGASDWKNIEIKADKTTVIKPGRIEIENADYRGHRILSEDGEKEHGLISSLAQSLTLIPGKYLAEFGSVTWPFEVETGKTTILKPGVLSLEGANIRGHLIKTKEGVEVGSVSQTGSSFTLPPGEYTVEIEGKPVPFVIAEGQKLSLENK